MKSKIITLISILIITSSCSTISMYGSGKVRNEDKALGTFVYQKSMSVGAGHIVLCALTGIFYGGWCWAYLGMPTSGHKDEFKESIITDLKNETGSETIILDDLKMERLSWSTQEKIFVFKKRFSSQEKRVKKTLLKQESKGPSDSSDDFLR